MKETVTVADGKRPRTAKRALACALATAGLALSVGTNAALVTTWSYQTGFGVRRRMGPTRLSSVVVHWIRKQLRNLKQ